MSNADCRYRLRMPEHIGDEGRLSSLQLEAIVYACQRHEMFLGDKERAGYLIGKEGPIILPPCSVLHTLIQLFFVGDGAGKKFR